MKNRLYSVYEDRSLYFWTIFLPCGVILDRAKQGFKTEAEARADLQFYL